MNEEIQELINLLYNNHISQYGKRKLEKYIKEMQKEIEKLEKESIGNTKYERLLFSIRMLHFHHYINDTQFEKMITKLSNEGE